MPDYAIVTAGSRRLGREIVLKLADMGYDIALHYNTSEDDAKTTAREVMKYGRRVELFRRNFEHFDEVLTLMQEIIGTMGGPPTILVNNASIFERNVLRETTPEQFDADFDVHVKAPYFLMRDFANNVERGHIINMVDTSITRTGTTYFTYLLSKKALYELTRMAAKELAPRIRVNAIAPGIILPPVGWNEHHAEKASRENLLQRQAGPADIVAALEYLVKSEQVTGECLYVDGGDHVDQ
jgi:NAD(P)-dependent dehydrogenase (short-subunit alcohol dehydrogenase family)